MYGITSVLLLGFFVSVTIQESVKVAVYYEALCPYSQEFVTEQLVPGYSVLGDSLLDLELVPYGKSKTKNDHGKVTFKCQHGPKECFANKIQACVLGQNYSQKQNVMFVGCIMQDHPQKKDNAKTCAKKYNIPWRSIKNCINGEQGTELLTRYGNETAKLNPRLEHVPTIVINGVYDENKEDAARNNFLKTVCDSFTMKPSVCSE